MQILNFRPIGHCSLVGLVDVHVPELGLKLYDVELHEKDELRWVQSPMHHSTSYANGPHFICDERGRPLYTTDFELDGFDAFSKAIWFAALIEGIGS